MNFEFWTVDQDQNPSLTIIYVWNLISNEEILIFYEPFWAINAKPALWPHVFILSVIFSLEQWIVFLSYWRKSSITRFKLGTSQWQHWWGLKWSWRYYWTLCYKILPVTSHLVLTDNLPPSHSYLRVLVDRVDTTQGAQGALARCFLNTHLMKYYDMWTLNNIQIWKTKQMHQL